MAARAVAVVAFCLLSATPSFSAPAYGAADFIGLGVWLQDTRHAAEYKKAGINTFVGFWGGMTQKDLDALAAERLYAVPAVMDPFAMGNLANRTIVAWNQQDEPDNAQMNKTTGKYDPCVAPAEVVARYKAQKAADPSRPVRLGLGQGVAWTDWGGRGKCTGNTDMYADYAAGADYIGYDIYPRNQLKGPCAQRLACVADGLTNLRQWSGGKPLFMAVETGPIQNTSIGPTPADTRAEVWMSIIHGATRIVYFCHCFKCSSTGGLDESHLLHEPAMLAEVTTLNARITSLASVINAADAPGVSVAVSPPTAPVAFLAKQGQGGTVYVFAVGMSDTATHASFRVAGGAAAEVLWENRTVSVAAGSFGDDFGPYEVHVYRVQ